MIGREDISGAGLGPFVSAGGDDEAGSQGRGGTGAGSRGLGGTSSGLNGVVNLDRNHFLPSGPEAAIALLNG